jgi:hypothetical protein
MKITTWAMYRVIFAAMICASQTANAQLAIPNVFQSGTPAKATDVNANFAAIQTAVNSSATNLSTLTTQVTGLINGVTVNVAGQPVGYLLALDPGSVPPATQTSQAVTGNPTPTPVSLGTAPSFQVLSKKGYIFDLIAAPVYSEVNAANEGGLTQGFLVYDQAACQGNVYSPVQGANPLKWLPAFLAALPPGLLPAITAPSLWYARQGFVFASPNPADTNPAYYIPAGSAPINVVIQSASSPGTSCLAAVNFSNQFGSSPTVSVVAVKPNNSSVTGVSSTLSGNVSLSLQLK